jgi:hypothetical protein
MTLDKIDAPQWNGAVLLNTCLELQKNLLVRLRLAKPERNRHRYIKLLLTLIISNIVYLLTESLFFCKKADEAKLMHCESRDEYEATTVFAS